MPYLPYPHFMCVAPLDAVLRVLWHAEGKIPPAYWPRLVLLLLLSGDQHDRLPAGARDPCGMAAAATSPDGAG